MNRRQFLVTTAAAALMAGVSMPKVAFGEDKVVKIGFLAPLTGEVAAWGKPGLDGLHIWGDRVNNAGGVPDRRREPQRSNSSTMTTNTIRARRAPARSSSSRKTASSSS